MHPKNLVFSEMLGSQQNFHPDADWVSILLEELNRQPRIESVNRSWKKIDKLKMPSVTHRQKKIRAEKTTVSSCEMRNVTYEREKST